MIAIVLDRYLSLPILVNMTDKTIIVRVSSDLHRAFKVKCAQDGTTMNKVLTDFIEGYIKESKPKKQK
jgi:hypothetical protein